MLIQILIVLLGNYLENVMDLLVKLLNNNVLDRVKYVQYNIQIMILMSVSNERSQKTKFTYFFKIISSSDFKHKAPQKTSRLR